MPATNAAGTATLLSETRACCEVRSARWKYQSTGVVEELRDRLRGERPGRRTGSMKPLWESTATARRPTGSRVVTGVSARPA